MGILRRFREWREDKNGVLTGPDIDADSLKTGSQEIGSADPVTGGPVGDSGELVELQCIGLGLYDTDFSNTSFQDIPTTDHRTQVDFTRFDLTNIGDIYFYWNVRRIEMDTVGETATVRLAGDSETYSEATVSDDSVKFNPDPAPEIEQEGGSSVLKLEAKVTGGTGSILGIPFIRVLGEIQ